MKRCRKHKKEKNSSKRMMKQCSTQWKSVPAKSWADLDLDVLGEIKKKLYWGDDARFSGVCKTWLGAKHEKRAGDVLPWLLLLSRHLDVNKVSYDLYQPHNLDPEQPLISGGIQLNKFFDLSRIPKLKSTVYIDGYLFVSWFAIDRTCTHFLLVSIRSNRATTDFRFEESLNPCYENVVFLRGLFYFLCYDQRLVSYDISSKELKVHSFLTPINYGGIYKFFKLDGQLMLMYYDIKVRKHFLSSYDWSQKLWVPLKDLGDRSLFLSLYSVYVDTINYYRVSPNKIYILKDDTCYVYSFENGQLLKSYSSGLRHWDGVDLPSECSLWVEPPDLLPK